MDRECIGSRREAPSSVQRRRDEPLGQRVGRRLRGRGAKIGAVVVRARAARIVEELGYSRLDGTIPKLRKKIASLDLLILDDFALSPLKKQELTDLFEVIEDRSTLSSVIMISQRPAVDWYDYIGDPLIADAFMDRVRSKAHLLQLEGRSMR